MYIAKDGAWFWDDKFQDISVFRNGTVEQIIARSSSPWLELNGKLQLVKKQSLGKVARCEIDVVFPVMHGSYGEDGALMGLLEMSGVPYVGCNVPASAIAMDKVLAKQVAAANGIPTAKWISCNSFEVGHDAQSVIKRAGKLRYPLFVKPAHAGSSIGITKVITESELSNALEVAAHYDEKIIVEEAVENLIEVTLPIIGNSTPQPALLEQPLEHGADFFDFETKYMNGGKKQGGVKGAGKNGAQGYSKLPAELPAGLYQKAESIGISVYKAIGCTGIARIDMLIDEKTGEVYFNEINPMPGSLYAHNWREAGVSGIDLVKRLIGLAEDRYEQGMKIQTSFATNYLKQF